MIDITLDVKGDGSDYLKLDWRTAKAPGPFYHVVLEKLRPRVAEVRERLQALIETAVEQRNEDHPLMVGNELKALAQAGVKLRKAIFFPAPIKHEEDEGYETEQWLAKLGDAILHVWIDRGIYIPWGLAYDGDPPEDDDPSRMGMESFPGFWCVKYRLSTLYSNITDDVVRSPRRSNEAQIVNLRNAAAWSAALSHVPPEEQIIVDQIFKSGAICSSQDFRKVWPKDLRNNTDLLYFFGHASGAALALDKTDLLTMEDIPAVLKRVPSKSHPACLVFLNGCHTAIGDPERENKEGFLQATAYKGYCGFIGTETVLPNVFALRFANEFLAELLYTGASASDVMDKLRRKHWPLSLVYNLSCHPDFRFDASGIEKPALPPIPNLSNDVIGSGKV
jgi:hypothetical protein